LPVPIRPTAIFELAWLPRTASGRTIRKLPAAAAERLSHSRRVRADGCWSMKTSQREL